jgi:Major capsid protein 13-like
MALSDLAVFNEYAYKTKTEVLRQQIELFNGATAGAITLQSAANQGDYNESAFFGKVSGGLVRRRNSYGSGTVAEKTLAHLRDVSVKVAAGTPPIRLDPGQYNWIQQNPKAAGAAMGIQLAQDTMADMLNTGLGACYSAMSQVSAIIYDATGLTAPLDLPSWKNLNKGQAKFGDASSSIGVWIMHSTPMHNLYDNNLTNGQGLFTYGTVNVVRDPFGKLLVMTDSSNLVTSSVYHTLGLVSGAVMIEENNDFDAAEETVTGDENIIRKYQAEWSYNVGIKGFRWDKANGGASPTNAALFTATNWDRYATSEKDLPGVIVETH